MTKHYIFKYGNQHFKEFQDYFYNDLDRRQRMEFKQKNNFRYQNGYLLNHITFLRYVRDDINKNYKDYFKFIIRKKEKIVKPVSFTVYFE